MTGGAMHLTARHYHFIGIGGIGMSGLAELLVRRGYTVSGSDLAANALTQKLQRLGVRFFPGHAPEHIHGSDLVVISSAIGMDNPELRAAQAQGLPILSRAQMLAALMAGQKQIAVAGTHGKTTTTSMVAAVLQQGGLSPSVMVGGVVDTLGSNAVWGSGQVFVAEADESDGSFLAYQPHVAVVTNVDRDHLDHYRDLQHIQEVFSAFLHQIQPDGFLVACLDDPHLRAILNGRPQQLLTYGLQTPAAYQARQIRISQRGSVYTLVQHDRPLGQIQLPLAGHHYVCNSLAAAAVGFALGLSFSDIQAGLAQTGRIKRRFELKGEARGITVVDDYGHHPTEIRVTLAAMAQAFAGRRLLVAFQPHRYSRTQALLKEFFDIFGDAHILYLTDIYGAGEAAIPGLSGYDLYQGVKASGHPAVEYVADRRELAAILLTQVRPGDVVVTMGAGDIWRTGEELLQLLDTRAMEELPSLTSYAVPVAEIC